MNGAMPAVVFDTNVYRLLAGKRHDARFDALVEAERQRQVARYADPLVVSELLAHLADPHDSDFARCRAAVVRIFQRCTGDGTCGVIRDSESRLAEAITGKRLEKHDAHTEQLCIMLERVARTPADQPLSEEENIRLRAIAEHFAGVEAKFADTMRRLQQTVGALLAEEEPNERRRIRKSSMRTLASEAQRMRIAETLLRYASQEAGISLPEPLPAALVARVRMGAAAAIEFEAQLWRRAAFDGANAEAAHIRNLRWDQRIAFNIGQTIGVRPLWLVTDDTAFAEVARATGHGDRVLTLAAYERWLGLA